MLSLFIALEIYLIYELIIKFCNGRRNYISIYTNQGLKEVIILKSLDKEYILVALRKNRREGFIIRKEEIVGRLIRTETEEQCKKRKELEKSLFKGNKRKNHKVLLQIEIFYNDEKN